MYHCSTSLVHNKNKLNGTYVYRHKHNYEGWNFNSGNYLFTTDTK